MTKLTQKRKSEPLFHITKRAFMPFYQTLIIRLVAIVLALVVCGVIITLLTKLNPLEVYAKMFEGNFGSSRKVWKMLQNIAILLCISLAVTPAFKMKFWNIGAQGQVLVGCLATAGCMIYFDEILPTPVLFIVMLLSAIIAGAIWGVIPAIFKAHYNTNETLFTLMMNYVAIQLVAFFEIFWENPKGSASIGIINQSTETGWIPSVFGSRYFINILIVSILTVVLFT